jgi:hypothetical protein
MQPILGYLRGLGIAPAALLPPTSGVLEATLSRYRGYLILERGIKDGSASRYIELMRPFLQTKVLPDGLALDLRSLTAADVISFVVCCVASAAMRRLRAGIETSVIALWLGHEQVETTHIYLHADMGIKERALAATAPAVATPGRFRPNDKLLSFLEAL